MKIIILLFFDHYYLIILDQISFFSFISSYLLSNYALFLCYSIEEALFSSEFYYYLFFYTYSSYLSF